MAKHTFTVNFDKFTAAIANSARSKLGKRGIKGGVEIDLTKIPDNVKTDLLLDAIRNYAQVGLKSIDQDTATTEQCQAAMQARVDLLYSGAVSAPGQARKAPARDPVLALAKAEIKKAMQARTEEKLDGRVLTQMVSKLFKGWTAWVKAGKPDDVKGVQGMKMIDAAVERARSAIEEQRKMSESLAALTEQAAKLSREAAEKKAAEAGEEAAPETEAPKPAKGKGKAPAR